ncbi:hypothetical protein [Adoxophyes orana nucleopolyhedrovirus]|uniref:hypothetical protein n=1 Tax=Adoxophyes orana nucleopolyhedrovirus TaxID=542343 RepID=UPI0001829C15|nr:hypothetical protein [Adoxophyes orana nucleopolyhedrovirus]ACF05362.1 hypothetical protein [Adoxophyes orana nucleopolyhedrovirus]
MSFTLIAAIAIIIMSVLVLFVNLLNPLNNEIDKIINDHTNTLQFGTYIEIYDASFKNNVERLFVIKPENVMIYNTHGQLFYYLESSSVICPREFSLLRISAADIWSINDSGTFTTLCTNVNSLALLEHFVVLKNNLADERILLPVDDIHYSILDLINLIISLGYVYIE